MRATTLSVLLAVLLVVLPAHSEEIEVAGFGPAERAAADTIGLVGPTIADPGEEITVSLTGTPPLDLTQPLADQLGWLMGEKRMFAYVAEPGQPLTALDVRGELIFSPNGATMRPLLRTTLGEPGEYRFLVDWNTNTPQLAEHVVTVAGQVDPPDPPLPPDPPVPPDPPDPEPTTAWQIMLFEDRDRSDNLSRDQVAMLSGRVFRDRLEADGHLFLGAYDVGATARASWERKTCYQDGTCVVVTDAPEELRVWWPHVESDPMPRVAIAPRDGGDIRDYPLPADEQEFFKELVRGFQ